MQEDMFNDDHMEPIKLGNRFYENKVINYIVEIRRWLFNLQTIAEKQNNDEVGEAFNIAIMALDVASRNIYMAESLTSNLDLKRYINKINDDLVEGLLNNLSENHAN